MTKDDLDLTHSALSDDSLHSLCSKYRIDPSLGAVCPSADQTIKDFPTGYIGLYSKFFEFANLRLPVSSFFAQVLTYFGVHISQLSPLGVIKITTFEVHCRALGGVPTVPLFRKFYKLGRAGDWYTIEKRKAPSPSCITYSPTSLKVWKKHFFWIRSDVVPITMSWKDRRDSVADPVPLDTSIDLALMKKLQKSPISVATFSEVVLVSVGLSTIWDHPGQLPSFVKNGRDMDLMDLIKMHSLEGVQIIPRAPDAGLGQGSKVVKEDAPVTHYTPIDSSEGNKRKAVACTSKRGAKKSRLTVADFALTDEPDENLLSDDVKLISKVEAASSRGPAGKVSKSAAEALAGDVINVVDDDVRSASSLHVNVLDASSSKGKEVHDMSEDPNDNVGGEEAEAESYSQSLQLDGDLTNAPFRPTFKALKNKSTLRSPPQCRDFLTNVAPLGEVCRLSQTDDYALANNIYCGVAQLCMQIPEAIQRWCKYDRELDGSRKEVETLGKRVDHRDERIRDLEHELEEARKAKKSYRKKLKAVEEDLKKLDQMKLNKDNLLKKLDSVRSENAKLLQTLSDADRKIKSLEGDRKWLIQEGFTFVFSKLQKSEEYLKSLGDVQTKSFSAGYLRGLVVGDQVAKAGRKVDEAPFYDVRAVEKLEEAAAELKNVSYPYLGAISSMVDASLDELRAISPEVRASSDATVI